MISDNNTFKKNILAALENSAKFPESVNARLKLRLVSCDLDKMEAVYEYDKKSEDLNAYGEVHGGMVCGLLDTCIGISGIAARGFYITTTDMATTFIRAMDADSFRIEIRLLKLGRKMVRGSGSVFEKESGKICASAICSYFVKEEAL